MNTPAVKALITDFKRIGLSLLNVALVAWLSVTTLTQPAQAVTTAQGLTVVSLTFDDGTQSAARAILANHGMKGTFYINSDRIGAGSPYITKAEVDALYADGNEIAGHTIGHVDLATLSDAAQQTAICNDMQNLVNWGYSIHSFAYPFGSTGPNTQRIIAAGCPGVGTYESARTVGGLVSGPNCTSCPWSETIPPGNPYFITTNSSVKSTTTLADLQGYVMQTENNGGGWVPLVIHYICDGCSTLAVSPATLDTFLTWLKAREPQGTYVRTVHQVMSGDLPVPPPPPQLGTNQLINPSLEIDADRNNQADCWQRSSSGTNRATWTRSNDAHTGSFSEQLKITSYTSGDRTLLAPLDAGQPGGCAPTVVGGDLYQLSAWYKATVPANMVLFYLDAKGVWQYWRDAPQLPASANWTQTIYYPGVVPTGAQALSFGIGLTRVGTLTTDDYSMALVLDSPPADSTPPVISGFSPANGSTVSGTVSLSASATDNVAMQRVEFLINGAVIATDTTSPYTASWDSTLVANGSVSYSVRAVDAAGNSTVAPAINIIVSNNSQSGNLLINPSLEIDANNDGVPDCWQLDSYGSNTVAWTRTSDAHTGGFAEQLKITSYTSGDRKVLPTQDAGQPGGCAPKVVGGKLYRLSAWYKATVPADLVLFYLDANGIWQYWLDGPQLPASAGWSQMTYTTGALPAGAQAFSFGIALSRVGTLTTDDYSMALVQDNPPPPDNTPPVISGFAPANGATVSGAVSLTASATDNVAVQRVEFLVHGAVIATDTTSPYAVSWDSTSVANGSVSYAVRAFDTAGNNTTSATHTLTVNNPTGNVNLLTNPSLEIDANNDKTPDCWQLGGYGANTFTWTRLSGAATAHSGNFAESLKVTSLTSGDRKLVQLQDSSACAPTITVGARYTASSWYKSTIPLEIAVYYRTSAGVWQFWQSSPSFAAANNWTQASYTTTAIPAGATAISFGLYISNVGTLITDDYAMALAP